MRYLVLGAAAIALSGCGPKTLELPDDPVDRAATCGVVAAAEARAGTADIKAPLSIDSQGRILHHVLLAASADGRFQQDTAIAVSRQMQVRAEEVTAGKWQDLVPACAAAFPETQIAEPQLPEASFDAQIGCDELANFMISALGPDDSTYAKESEGYRALQRRFNQSLAPGLRSRAGSELAGQRELRAESLADMAERGSPTALLAQCIERYG